MDSTYGLEAVDHHRPRHVTSQARSKWLAGTGTLSKRLRSSGAFGRSRCANPRPNATTSCTRSLCVARLFLRDVLSYEDIVELIADRSTVDCLALI